MPDMSVNWALKKQKASYSEVFQYAIGLAVTEKISAMGEEERHGKLRLITDQGALLKLLEKKYTSINLERLLDIAEQLDVEFELISKPSNSE